MNNKYNKHLGEVIRFGIVGLRSVARNFGASSPSVFAARGRSLEMSWLCRLRVAVERTTGVSLRKLHCTAGTR